MKVAIVHDVFIEFGGAERVLLALLELYPSADLYIPLLSSTWKTMLASKSSGSITSTFFNRIPLIHSASILLKPFLYLYWEQLDLTKYDVVISSSHSFSSKSVITGPGTRHISYIHTPPRYLYTEYNETRALKHPIAKVLLSPLLSWLRVRDFIGAQRPDMLIANSRTVQARIMKYYRRESTVIYPPVDIPARVPTVKKEYFLCVSRLARQKWLDIAIRVCNTLRVPLVIVGTGSQEAYLRSISGPTITFRGWVPDEGMADIYAHAKALIYCSIDEDFGIVPVEAMAHGVPVIAYRSGAVSETVLDERTGIMFDVLSVEHVRRSLERLSRCRFSAEGLARHAAQFSRARFLKNMRACLAPGRPEAGGP